MNDCLIGYDIGSSAIKAALMDAKTGKCLAETSSPQGEMSIDAPQSGWAEQNPEQWWAEVKRATYGLRESISFQDKKIIAIGVTYQMHGLVCVDKEGEVLRPAIIWCDSRSVDIGAQAFEKIGKTYCLAHYLNSPGNFTLSKLKWVKENQPAIFEKIYKIMLPGDYIVYRLTRRMSTTTSGLSEAVAWDFKEKILSFWLLEEYGISPTVWPDIVPTFGLQGQVSSVAAEELNLPAEIPVTYRAGDQPNNAYALRVLHPGELAATAGTSGVVYGITNENAYDPLSRINTFMHVNHTDTQRRNGVLLCVNGTGSAYSWARRVLKVGSYSEMNALGAAVPLEESCPLCFPFGNGAERILENQNPGAAIVALDYNLHDREHLVRSVTEGIAFSLRLGLEILEQMMDLKVIRAGRVNMFLSPLFSTLMANLTGAIIEIYDTNGAQGAARAAGVGAGYYSSFEESYVGLQKAMAIHPDKHTRDLYLTRYQNWKKHLRQFFPEVPLP